MSETKHTPTPWKLNDTDTNLYYTCKDGSHQLGLVGNELLVAHRVYLPSEEVWQPTDSAFLSISGKLVLEDVIQKANSHDALARTLSHLTEAVELAQSAGLRCDSDYYLQCLTEQVIESKAKAKAAGVEL